MVAARLRQITSRDNAEFDAQVLEQDGHQVGGHNNAQQRVAELGATRQVSRPVTRVHVTDGHQEAGAGEGSHFLPEGDSLRNCDATMDFRQGGQFGSPSPGGGGLFSGRQVRAVHRCVTWFLSVERVKASF